MEQNGLSLKWPIVFQISDKSDSAKNVNLKQTSIVGDNLEEAIHNLLLEKYVPPSVVVNQELEILQFKGSIGSFLEPSPGKASLNLLKMARPGLSFELRNIIHKVTKSGKAESKNGIEVKSNGSSFHAAIEALPISANGEERVFLILFKREENMAPHDVKTSASKDKIVKQLQLQLNTLKDDMRSILEEQEAR